MRPADKKQTSIWGRDNLFFLCSNNELSLPVLQDRESSALLRRVSYFLFGIIVEFSYFLRKAQPQFLNSAFHLLRAGPHHLYYYYYWCWLHPARLVTNNKRVHRIRTENMPESRPIRPWCRPADHKQNDSLAYIHFLGITAARSNPSHTYIIHTFIHSLTHGGVFFFF